MVRHATSSIHLSPIDEERFGIRVAKTVQVSLDNLSEIETFCRSNAVVLLIARCSVFDLAVIQAMERQGFELMDSLVYYARDLVRTPLPEVVESAVVRPVQPGEADAIQAVAAEAFRGYFGHYHADSRLDREKCDEVYRSWAYRSCVLREVADEVLVAEADGKLQGFLTLKINNPAEGEGRLLGVLPSARGTGMAALLMSQALAWFHMRGMSQMLISTQITNLASQKVWIRLGFEPHHAYYTLHKWFH